MTLAPGADRSPAREVAGGPRHRTSGPRRGERGTSLPPGQRSVGVVFQDYALFPHLSVRDNVGYVGGRRAGLSCGAGPPR